MPYTGENINYCMNFDFKNAYAVVVSGGIGNSCDHMLLNTGGPGGQYFHIAALHDRPKYLDSVGYQRYLRENHKREMSRTKILVPKPEAANIRLQNILMNPWLWLGVAHNCVSFVEEVVQAGGSSAGLWFNCPSKETFK